MKLNLLTILLKFTLISSTLLITSCANNQQIIDGQDEIKKELAEIKDLLKNVPSKRKPKPFKPTDVSITGDPSLGLADAPLTIIEFTDYQCPFCKRFAVNTFPQLIKNYVDSGKVRYVLKELPLKGLHPKAEKLAHAALCAGDQGKYWEMHDRFFKAAKKPNPDNVSEHVTALKLNTKAFNKCTTSNKFKKQIAKDLYLATKLGIRGTPSFILGKSKKGDKNTVHATTLLKGAQPFAAFKANLDNLLK